MKGAWRSAERTRDKIVPAATRELAVHAFSGANAASAARAGPEVDPR